MNGPNKAWTESDYCLFHKGIQKRNIERIKFVHTKRNEDGKVIFYKYCPQCFVRFDYPPLRQSTNKLEVPKLEK